MENSRNPSGFNRRERVVSGEEFRAWREAKGLSLKQIARRLGITRTAVQKFDQTGITQVQALALTASLAGLKHPWACDTEDLPLPGAPTEAEPRTLEPAEFA